MPPKSELREAQERLRMLTLNLEHSLGQGNWVEVAPLLAARSLAIEGLEKLGLPIEPSIAKQLLESDARILSSLCRKKSELAEQFRLLAAGLRAKRRYRTSVTEALHIDRSS